MISLFAAAILILALLDGAHAHFVWLERDGDGPVRAHFGEWVELVPTTPDGKSFVLLFFNAPLPKPSSPSSVRPNGKTLSSPTTRAVTLPTPWAGQYVLEVTHFDENPGGSREEKFSRTRHRSSLSFTQPTGLTWPDKR